MSMPKDLPGQVRHVFEPSRQREVLENMAKAIEALQPKAVEPPPFTVVSVSDEPVEVIELPKKGDPFPEVKETKKGK